MNSVLAAYELKKHKLLKCVSMRFTGKTLPLTESTKFVRTVYCSTGMYSVLVYSARNLNAFPNWRLWHNTRVYR